MGCRNGIVAQWLERSDVMSDRSQDMAYVYIIKSGKNKRYYIGSTTDVGRRLKEHNAGKTPSTRYLMPWELIFSQEYPNLSDARRIEKKLKSFKNREIIDRIVSSGSISLKF